MVTLTAKEQEEFVKFCERVDRDARIADLSELLDLDDILSLALVSVQGEKASEN